MSRFSKLRLVTSPNHLYKKLEEYGVDHDEIIKSMVKNDAKWLVSRKEKDDSNDTSASVADAKPSAGYKLTIDNVDYTQNVHYMTEEHQNNDKHYVSINATVNRVSANHLSDESTANGINQMENGKCIPNHFEQKAQRNNYIALVQRVIVEYVPCLGFGKDLLEKHIPHMYTKETSQPTDSVSIFKKYLGFLTWGEVIPVFSLSERYHKCPLFNAFYDIGPQVIKLISPRPSCDNLHL